MAEFVSDTLSNVLTTDQMYEIVEKNNDPKFLDNSLTPNQRAKISAIVLSTILNPSQLNEFATHGGVSTSSLDSKQQQIVADLTAGYTLGQVLNFDQFNDYINRKPFALSVNQMDTIRAGGITQIPEIDPPSVYSQMRKRDSKYIMELGRYMSEPATNFLRLSSGRGLSGGGLSLLQFKNKIDSLVF